jgi:hypothetical protein
MVAIIGTHATSNLHPDALPAAGFMALKLLLSGTVGFTTVSGMLVGYFCVTKANDFSRIAARYRKQALRLAVVAHPLIAIALYAPLSEGEGWLSFALGRWYITDVLAVLFAFVVPVMPRIPPRGRLLLGISLLLVSRVLGEIPVSADQFVLLLARDILAGVNPNRDHVLSGTYALVSLAGMFLIGSWVGHVLASAERGPAARRRFMQRLLVGALALLPLSAAMLALWAGAKFLGLGGAVAPAVRSFLYPDYHLTFYPVYLAATLVLLAFFLSRPDIGPGQRFLILVGKTSLFTYVVQYYVVQTIPYFLGWQGEMSVGTVIVFVGLALPILGGLAAGFNRYVKKA